MMKEAQISLCIGRPDFFRYWHKVNTSYTPDTRKYILKLHGNHTSYTVLSCFILTLGFVCLDNSCDCPNFLNFQDLSLKIYQTASSRMTDAAAYYDLHFSLNGFTEKKNYKLKYSNSWLRI